MHEPAGGGGAAGRGQAGEGAGAAGSPGSEQPELNFHRPLFAHISITKRPHYQVVDAPGPTLALNSCY